MRRATPEEVRAVCCERELDYLKTDSIKPLESIVGQERATRALAFGLEMELPGFHIFAAGLPGTGRTTAIKEFLEVRAKDKPTPPDWCYVFNFKDPYEPKAIELPPGWGKELARDMKNFISAARREIPRAFESEEYVKKRDETIAIFNEKKERLFRELHEKARQMGFLLQPAPTGLFIIPMKEGRPMEEQEFAALPKEAQEDLIRRRKELEAEVTSAFRERQNLDRQAYEAIKELDRQVVNYILEFLQKELQDKYHFSRKVLEYLEEVKKDILNNLPLFRERVEGEERKMMPWLMREDPFRRYEVNVFIDNSSTSGAPVVVEYNPTFNNLVGRIEREAVLGALITDFTMIRPGSLHRANGGYLVIPVEEVLKNPFAWEGLKRCLREGKVIIEDIGERIGLLTTKTLQPEPIPLDLKVILVGTPLYYYLLYLYDHDFHELFKVKAEFGVTMDRNPDNIKNYAAFCSALCAKENLLHLDASAVAKLVEYGSRLAEDQTKLSTRFAILADVIREACCYARKEGVQYISASHIKQAIEARFYRSNLIEERIREMIARGFIKIEVTGRRIGQVNGLSVIDLGDIAFGRPNKITATVAAGREGIIDIEREARLGGRIHTKGVLILNGYLNEKYQREAPLTLAARLVFEQSYEGVEGDSASSAELFALLSALADLPVRQDLAVTGSVNQKGEIQAVGGINEKIEGFYDTVKVMGLTGEQGVVIPAANKDNLMLREDAVEAIREGRFHVYFINTVDEGIELLTGVPAGERGPDGHFPPDTVHGRVARKLEAMAAQIKAKGEREEKKSDNKEKEEGDKEGGDGVELR